MTPKETKLTRDQQELIERVGVVLEGSGMAPAPARVSALLIVTPEAELPFDDISRLLKLSKSATSNALNFLMNMGNVEYITKPGERRRYFRVRVMSWKEDTLKAFQGLSAMSAVYKDVLAQRPKTTRDFNRSLTDLAAFIDHMVEELPALFKKWEQRR